MLTFALKVSAPSSTSWIPWPLSDGWMITPRPLTSWVAKRLCGINRAQVNQVLKPVETQRLILASEAVSFTKPVFWDSKVKWSLACFKAQPGPGSSLTFSLVTPATLPTSSLTSSLSFQFPGARLRPQVGQAHTRQSPKQVQGPGPCAPQSAGHDPQGRLGR